MKLILYKNDAVYETILPQKAKGQYGISYKNSSENTQRILNAEGIGGNWVIKPDRNVEIINEENRTVKEAAIKPLCFYKILLRSSNERALLFAEPLTDDRLKFTKFAVPNDCRIIIGRNEDCDIVYNNKLVSAQHVALIFEKGKITIQDLNSSNGTFLNSKRVKTHIVNPGDDIFLLGLKIIASKKFIAVNNPDNMVSCKSVLLKEFVKQEIEEDEEDNKQSISNDEMFHRSPRFRRDIKDNQITIDPPPQKDNGDGTPMIMILGPSVTMGMASIFTAFFSVMSSLTSGSGIMNAMPTLVMAGGMAVGTIVWPILAQQYEKVHRFKKERKRKKLYRKYIDVKKQEIVNEIRHEREILNENYVDISDCVRRIQYAERNLWERSIEQEDFLCVRLGTGDSQWFSQLKFPEKKFTLEKDVLMDEMYSLADTPKLLKDVPITLSLRDQYISGIIGERSLVKEFVKDIIFQIAALHSYDELKMVFVYDRNEKDVWNFVKWLPHVWDDEHSIRFAASNTNELKELTAYFKSVIAARKEAEDDSKIAQPYYAVFLMNKSLAGRSEFVDEILKSEKNLGFSIICLYDELWNLPKECSTVVELSGKESKLFNKNDITGAYTKFSPNLNFKYDAGKLSSVLANIKLDSGHKSYVMPTMVTFLNMYGVGKIEHLNILTRWKENNPVKSLQCPIGIDTNGELFQLDLHQKFHGPHGLIAGMTGSGKSELVMSLILSLAVNYHPYEVAFILIDYKGGGMANAFTNLPHVVGTITNLDGAAVKRSLAAIESELKRRQAIFNKAGRKTGESNIDIYKYQKLYREDIVSEPLQHLFIISDEFAELKTQQPDFMDQLVSAARIGRSLGVHLILATQKPSGVVDDQIWSNTKFRICLKVQEKADSMDVIKRQDAAELSITGRFYLQVGFNELFQMGQSAWSGAPYIPSDKINAEEDRSVSIIDLNGKIVKSIKPENKIKTNKKPPKQIDEITNYIAKISEEEGIKNKPLWLEPIPALIYVDDLIEKYNVSEFKPFVFNPVIGEIDDPENQRQAVMTLPITEKGNVIVYGAAGNGKTTFLTTMLYSLIQRHTPEELNIYILDFSSETLKAFSKAPQVGDVLLLDDSEKIKTLFNRLNKEIARRKKAFAEFGGDYNSYINYSGKKIPAILIVIHNFSAFLENYEDYEDAISYLTREGTKYGILFVLTALTSNAVRYRISQNFKQLLVLQMNDETDYSVILGNTGGMIPASIKGRGLIKTDKIYEFQIAHAVKTEDMFAFIRNYCIEKNSKQIEFRAKAIPVLPKSVNIDYFQKFAQKSADYGLYPVGVENENFDIVNFDFSKAFINMVLSQDTKYSLFMQGIAEIAQFKGFGKTVVIDADKTFLDDNEKKYEYASDYDEIVVKLFNMLVERNNKLKDAKENGTNPPEYEHVLCIINGLTALKNHLTDDCKDKLNVLMEKGESSYNVNFIVSDCESNIGQVTYEQWFQKHVSLENGIWIGSGLMDQYLFKVNDQGIRNRKIENGCGYVINRGKPKIVKLLETLKNTEDESDE